MGLPKISQPTFKIEIPSTGKEFRFRPFTVREEKVLLLAQSANNPGDILGAIIQVINNCLVDELDVNLLTTFDVEYLFIKLRARSINNIISVEYREEDGSMVPIKIDLDTVGVKYFDEHEDCKVIKLDDKLGMTLRYPRPEMIYSMRSIGSEEEAIFTTIKYCIDTVFDEDKVYEVHSDDYTEQDLEEFIESLPPTALDKIKLFIETIPRLHHVINYKTKAGEDKQIVLQSLNDFFMLG